MPWRMDCIDRLHADRSIDASQINQIDYLAEIILPPSSSDQAFMQACR
jgi:hypothetical protein